MDAISRAAAIKAMDDLEQADIELYGCPIPEGFDGRRAIEALQKLPSVTPKQKMGIGYTKKAMFRTSGNAINVPQNSRQISIIAPTVARRWEKARIRDDRDPG